jgi:hypothetical protein
MAIVVLVLWLFTAGAGFYLLFTSNLGRARPAPLQAPAAAPAPVPAPAPATSAQSTPATQDALVTQAAPAPGSQPTPVAASASVATSAGPASRHERRAARDPFAPPSLVASRQAPIVPDLRSVAEFAHPACAISGLGFWLGFTLVHARVLAWIAFGLIVLTACIGLAWFTANTRAARRHADARPAPSFTSRLILLHGGAAAVTLTLAALTALVARG